MFAGSLCTAITGFIDEVSPDLDEQIAAAREMGLDGVEIRSCWDANVTALSGDQLAQIRDSWAESGISITGVGSPVNKVSIDADPALELEKLEKSIAAAHVFETSRIRIFSPTAGDLAREEDWTKVRDWLAPHVEMAKGEGVILLHENDSRFYGAFPEGSRHILEEFGSSSFQAVFDVSNSTMIGLKTMDDWFPWLTPYLESLHIKDYSLADQRIVPAGDGDGQFPELLAYLRDQGWSGPMTLEPHAAHAGGFGGFSGKDAFALAHQKLVTLLQEATQS